MRLRHRVLLLVIALVAMAAAATAVLGTYLIDGMAALLVGAARGGSSAGPVSAGETAVVVLWLGALALGVVVAGLGIAAVRLWLVGPVERAARAVEADEVPSLPTGPAELRSLVTALVTQRRELDAARREMGTQLDALARYRSGHDETAAQLVAADRLGMTGQLALGLTHELGGPLAVAIGALDLVGAASDDDSRARNVARVDEALSRLDSLIAEFASFGAPLSHGTAGEPAATDASAVIRHVIALSRCHRRCRRAQIAFFDDDHAAWVALAPGPLEQILLNLIVNAADATGGEGRVEIRVQLIADGRWQICVDDDGPGVPIDQRARVFEPFVTTKSAGSGSGLGLAVSRGLARAVGGDVQASEAELGGARFTVVLPASHGGAALH